MRKEIKTRKLIGFLFIILGIALPLYGFSALSKNIVINKMGYNSFLENSATSDEELARIEEYNDSLSSSDTNIVDPFATDEFKTNYGISEDPDAVFAYLRIPALDLVQPIRLDASDKHMADGVAHVDGTSLPVGGMDKRSVIAGHRGYYQSIMFLYLDDLVPGDKVYVDRGDETLTYQVMDKEIINPSQWQKLNPEEGKDLLTLLTCDPFMPPRPHRLLVHCERVVQVVDDVSEIRADVVDSDANASSNIKVKASKYAILGTTAVLWILLVIVVTRFIKLIRIK